MTAPLSQLDTAACRGLVGVVFDVDDTVTRRGRLELDAFAAMHRLVESGLQLIAVTGRPLGWVDVLALHWPVLLAVGENGAGWAWRDGDRLAEGYFEDAAAREEYPALLERIDRRVKATLPEVRPARDQRARRCDLAYDIGETVRLTLDEVGVLVALIEAEGARSTVSSVHAHVLPGDWDKARGVVRAATEVAGFDLEAERDRWLFIGDSSNDAAAFEYFPVSVGVSNVQDFLGRVPAPPRFITAADRGRGFAEMADYVVGARAGEPENVARPTGDP